jgi:phosphoglycolate phosphatase
VNSNSAETVRYVLEPEHAAHIMYYARGASIFGKQAHFRRVPKGSGVRPADALCIGDEIRDYEAVTAVGMPFGAVAWSYTTIEALVACAPAAVFQRSRRLLCILREPARNRNGDRVRQRGRAGGQRAWNHAERPKLTCAPRDQCRTLCA